MTTAKTTVAPDGKTARAEFIDNASSNGATVAGEGSMSGMAKRPLGTHAISGEWLTQTYAKVPDSGLSFTYRSTSTATASARSA